MDLLTYFGVFIAERIHKDLPSVRGLLRLAIKDQFGLMPDLMDYADLRKVFEGPLKNRLEKLSIPEVPRVIQDLIEILTQRQAIFTMVRF